MAHSDGCKKVEDNTKKPHPRLAKAIFLFDSTKVNEVTVKKYPPPRRIPIHNSKIGQIIKSFEEEDDDMARLYNLRDNDDCRYSTSEPGKKVIHKHLLFPSNAKAENKKVKIVSNDKKMTQDQLSNGYDNEHTLIQSGTTNTETVPTNYDSASDKDNLDMCFNDDVFNDNQIIENKIESVVTGKLENFALEEDQECCDNSSKENLEVEMNDEKVNDELETTRQILTEVISGSIKNVPPIDKKIVRIFTSSTFTDTTLERNCLLESVYPKLKEYCMERYGLDFQAVDMRWGVRDEATDDHTTTELCMNEIDNCQRLSLGPNFVVLLGQKYGYRPLPNTISETMMLMLQLSLESSSPADWNLISIWYKRDENALPTIYVLQPISSILVHFNNKKSQHLRGLAQTQWWATLRNLQVILRNCASKLFLDNRIDDRQMREFIISVTEREVRRGLINCCQPEKHCLAYIRNIDNMATDHLSRNFIDKVGDVVDQEACALLSELRDNLIPKKLDAFNISYFNVEWSKGINLDDHAQYIKDFCEIFFNDVCRLVDQAAYERTNYGEYASLFTQVQQHLHACSLLCQGFTGREQILKLIETYLRDESHEPLILHGNSGCGKTSLMAKAFSLLETWFEDNPLKYMKVKCLKMIRFLGTSVDSSGVVPLLTSLCNQISYFFTNELDNNVPIDFNLLVSHFKNLLKLATKEKPIILFLDSLDQLSSANGAHCLTWFPLELPNDCKLVVSVVTEQLGLLEKLKKLLRNKSENLLNISSLGKKPALVVIKTLLGHLNRTLNAEQWKIVEQTMECCSEPLFIKILTGVVSKWRSYEVKTNHNIVCTVHDAIMQLFDKIENNHGKILVSHAISFITASKEGVTETELEDMLSLDETVLNDVYQYHLPPVRRIPPLLWTRIRSDLSDYITEKEADGVNVINWYHKQFDEVSRKRYLKNDSFKIETHFLMADYFIGTWGGVSKPFHYSALQCQRFNLVSNSGSCDRKVPEQPLFYVDKSQNINNDNKLKSNVRYNLRKLSELPRHLIKSKRFDELFQMVLFNYKWLHAKLSCTPLQSIIEDFEESLSEAPTSYQSIKMILDGLKLSASILIKRSEMLGPQLTGRLLPVYNLDDWMETLLKQCDTEGIKINCLVPCFHCFQTPGGPLESSLEGHQFAPFGLALTSDSRYLVSASNKFIVWKLDRVEMVRHSSIGTLGIVMQMIVTTDDTKAIAYTNNNQLLIYTILSGETKLIENAVATTSEELIGIACSRSNFIVWSASYWALFNFTGRAVERGNVPNYKNGGNIISIYLGESPQKDFFLIWKEGYPLGVRANIDINVSKISLHHKSVIYNFPCHSGFIISRDKKYLYTCTKDNSISRYTLQNDSFHTDTEYSNKNKIYSIFLSADEMMLGSTHIFGYSIWDSDNSNRPPHVLTLPKDVRNFPKKLAINDTAVFSSKNCYLIAPVRNILYIWKISESVLVNVLNLHFGRILSIQIIENCSDTHDNRKVNKFLTSSLDKSIKIWNVNYIHENVYPIDSHEKQIYKMKSFTYSEKPRIMTVTRNCIGLWDLNNGKMIGAIKGNKMSSIITDADITDNGKHIVSVESGIIIIWDAEILKMVRYESNNMTLEEREEDILQIFITDDKHFLVVKTSTSNEAICEMRTIPSKEIVYVIDYSFKIFKPIITTSDKQYFVVANMNTQCDNLTVDYNDQLTIFHLAKGERVCTCRPKYRRFKDCKRVIAMPNKGSRLGLIDEEKGNLWDWRKKSLLVSIKNWSGQCSPDGLIGLSDPTRGGLDVINLKTGAIIRTLVPRPAEGVFPENQSHFTANMFHVYFYHSGKQSVRVFRLSDGSQIANYKVHATVVAEIINAQESKSLILGGIDGTLVILLIADPEIPSYIQFLNERRKFVLSQNNNKLN